MCVRAYVLYVYLLNKKKQFLCIGKSIKCNTRTQKQLTALPKWSFKNGY